MQTRHEICEVCERPIKECICCPECGHICGLDYGEKYCPVCFPEEKADERFMRLAIKEAAKALLKNEVPVGTVLVKNNIVIATAHNMRETKNDPTAHAEIIALKEGASEIKSWRLTDATLYVTKEPCVMCAGAMVNARLKRLVYGCKDKKSGAVDSLYNLLSDKRLNHRVELISGVLEDECDLMLKRFFQSRRNRTVLV
ncbi:MAG: tRNA adenosine(34) deaminase TadA [Bacteroidetes bacterium]|nr:tRNA adenosine(34) deaminase TadA [Bacteroidota bacterium]